MAGRGLCKDRKGQFVVLISLGIVMVMVSLAGLLAYTALSPMQFPDTDFRETVTELDLNFRRGLAVALADASKELEHKASTVRYVNVTKLEDYPEAEKKGWEFITRWHNTTLMKRAGLGINITISTPVFECDWGSSQGYSRAEANMSFDIQSYGFYGWNGRAIVEANATVLGLKETDGNETSFFFVAKKEFGLPITDLTVSQTRVLFQKASGTFRSTVVSRLTYYGGGTYLGTYLLEYYTDMLPILDGLNLLKTQIMDLEPWFIPPNSPIALNNKVDAVISQYTVFNYYGAYDKLLHDVRPHLDTSTNQTWVNGTDTSRSLALIDDILSQLFPRIRLFLNDPRGITVGAYSALIRMENDTLGPRAGKIRLTPDPVIDSDWATLTVEFTDSQSDILCAEYFIDIIGMDGTGISLSPTDGAFDSPIEEVRGEIDVSGWQPGNYTIYVHARDSVGNWGDLTPVLLRVIETPRMHIASIEMSLETRGRQGRAVAVVTIVDSQGSPVEDAMVYGRWSGATDQPPDPSGRTNDEGRVTFKSQGTRGGTFTFTVLDVTLSGWIYDEAANVETSDSISG